jgi:hypothetical protein
MRRTNELPEVAVLLAGGTYEPWIPRPPDLRFAPNSDGRLHEIMKPTRKPYTRREPPVWEARDDEPELEFAPEPEEPPPPSR